jgi:hypothetical protein
MANLFPPRRARKNSKIFKNAIFALVSAALIFAAAADGAQQYFYSVHCSSFKNLENANRQVNSLQEKGKMVFWKKTDVPGKGLYYRVSLGRYDKRDDGQSFAMKQLRHTPVLSNGSLIHSSSTRFKKRPSIPLTDNTLFIKHLKVVVFTFYYRWA